jgi:hypothetical protein
MEKIDNSAITIDIQSRDCKGAEENIQTVGIRSLTVAALIIVVLIIVKKIIDFNIYFLYIQNIY